MIDTAIIMLCLLACMAAECMPLTLSLLAVAGALTVYQNKRKTAPSGNDTQSGMVEQESCELNCFTPILPETSGDCQATDDLIDRAVGYFVLKSDIPAQNFLTGDQIYCDNDPQTTARLVIGMWDNTAHICQREPRGRLLCWCCDCAAPADAVVVGGALFVLRMLQGYGEATT